MVTSQLLNQKSLSLATMAKSAIDNCFGEIECSGHQIAGKKLNNTFVTVNNEFWVTRDAICQRFYYWQIASRVTQNSLFTVTNVLFFICLHDMFLKVLHSFTWIGVCGDGSENIMNSGVFGSWLAMILSARATKRSCENKYTTWTDTNQCVLEGPVSFKRWVNAPSVEKSN